MLSTTLAFVTAATFSTIPHQGVEAPNYIEAAITVEMPTLMAAPTDCIITELKSNCPA